MNCSTFSSADNTSSDDVRPDWWPDHLPWTPESECSSEVLSPPLVHTWPRLPPDHPYHVPPGYEAPNNLPPGHPGEYYPSMPPYPVVYPGESNDDSEDGETSFGH